MIPRPLEIVAQFLEKDALVTVRRRGDVHEVLFDGRIILSSEVHETEAALGALADTLCPSPTARVLIGGLGFGYTLRGALDVVGAGATVVVAERVPRIIELCRGLLAPLARDPLSDPRVRVVEQAVQQVLATAGPFDLVLLDVDNGPDWATFRDNAWLYSDAGVQHCAAALTPLGHMAVWSGYPAQGFLRVLRRAGLEAREIPLRVRGHVRARAYVGCKGRLKSHGPTV